MKLSPCGRFVVLDGLHLDRDVARALDAWASPRGLSLQDAVQLAALAFVERVSPVVVRPREREGTRTTGRIVDRAVR